MIDLLDIVAFLPGSPGARPEQVFVICLAVFVYGIFRRGLKSITAWLMLIPVVMWGFEAFVLETDLEGCWSVTLIGTTALILFCWVGAGLNQDIDEGSVM